MDRADRPLPPKGAESHMTRTARSLITASLCAAALTGQFVSGKGYP
jgi:hypothetical protein